MHEPTREDYIIQIEADLETEGGESNEVLQERLALVRKAKTDSEAEAAYHGHLKEQRA